MKSLTLICIIFCAVIIYSCNNNPVSTNSLPPHGSQAISLTEYGEKLDSTYYKVWSDSSWEEFARDTTISGTKYTVLLDNTGYEYFYGPNGYSGFWPYGGNLVMFDSALAAPPDTMIEGKTYTVQTTFSTQGINYVYKDELTPIDTATVTVPFGTFKNCIEVQITNTISGAGQTTTSTTEYWFAKGPSDIMKQFSSVSGIKMAYGEVNDQHWSATSGEVAPGIRTTRRKMDIAQQNSPGGFGPNIHLLAPKIFKGAVN